MTRSDKGWSWFERDGGKAQETSAAEHTVEALDGYADPDRELCLAYARCFGSPEGQKVLKHMRAITLERAYGPNTPAQVLRHIEGQRQLVGYITGLAQRGRNGG